MKKEEMKRFIRMHPSLPPISKLLGTMIVDLSNDEGVCAITNKYISLEIGTSDRSVERAIHSLRKTSIIRTGKEDDEDGRSVRHIFLQEPRG